MPDNTGRFFKFWKELKRRKVLRSLAIYAGTAFIILEASTIIFPRWNFPDWSIDLVLWLLILGAFINIIIAWIYDITPGGVQKTKPLEEISSEEKTSDSRGWKAATYISLVVIAALVVFNVFNSTKTLKAGDIQSLLILPFDNFTGDDRLDYVAAGMHSSLIGDMGQVSGLRVISKTTASIYKNLDMSLPQIATELNADAVVEPTVMCYGDSVCIQIRIITPFPEEKQIWIAEYKEERSQIMNLYHRVTKKIADEVKVQLTSEEEQLLAESRTINTEAYDFYLKGLYYWDQFTPEALQLALEYFNKAIETDPEWAEPYAGVAYFWVAIHQFSLAPSSVTIPGMQDNMKKAIEMDPNSGFVHYVNAFVSGWIEYNWEKMESEFIYVLEKNPNDAFAHMYYAHLLACIRSGDKAVSHCRIALDLDPLNPMIQALSTLVLADAGEYEEGISMAEKVLAVVPGHPAAISNLAGITMILGEHRKALGLFAMSFNQEDEAIDSILKIFDEQGFNAALNKLITDVEMAAADQFPMDLGQLYALAGDEKKALYWYEKGYEDHHPMMPYVGTVYGSGGPFKIDDPGFDSLLIKMNIPLK